MARVFVPPFVSNSLIPGNCNWEVHFTLTKNDFLLVKSNIETNDYIIQLEKADLHVNRVRLSEAGRHTMEVQLHSATLSNHSQVTDFINYQSTSISITKGQLVR